MVIVLFRLLIPASKDENLDKNKKHMIGLKVLARSMDTPTSSGCCAYSW
jgi:hypothetical protein